MEDDLPGGDYSFYLMVESNGRAPVFSDFSAAYTFPTIDTEAPDQIQVVAGEWKSTGTVVTWEAPWDDQGVAGYRIRYTTGDEDMAEVDVKTNTFTFDNVPNGMYDFQVAAYDAAGNLSAWSEQQSCLVLTAGNAKYQDIVSVGAAIFHQELWTKALGARPLHVAPCESVKLDQAQRKRKG